MWQREDWRREIYRVSRLDEFRQYLSGVHYDQSDYTAEDLIQRLTAPEPPSPKMEAGTAVHAVVEHSLFGELPENVVEDGWKIYFALDGAMEIPEAREVPLQRTHKGVTLYGRVDAIDAVAVHDIKTTSSIDIDRYADAYQWRAYLWMSGRRDFVYHVLRVRVDEDEREVTVLEYVPCRFRAYPAMERDVENLLLRYDAAVRALGIPEIMEGGRVAA